MEKADLLITTYKDTSDHSVLPILQREKKLVGDASPVANLTKSMRIHAWGIQHFMLFHITRQPYFLSTGYLKTAFTQGIV